jgi:hypothetical protein
MYSSGLLAESTVQLWDQGLLREVHFYIDDASSTFTFAFSSERTKCLSTLSECVLPVSPTKLISAQCKVLWRFWRGQVL